MFRPRNLPLHLITYIFISFIVISSFPAKAKAYEQDIKLIATRLNIKISASSRSSIAVVDFTDLNGDVSALGKFLAEEVSTALVDRAKNYRVIDRTHLQAIMAEHKLSSTGLIDPSTARRLGKIAGVDALLTGTITPMGDFIRITVKLLDTETARIICAEPGRISMSETLTKLSTVPAGERRQDEFNQASTSTPRTKQTVNKNIEIVPAKGHTFYNEFKIINLRQTSNGDTEGNFTFTALRHNEYLALFNLRNNTFLTDEIGNKYGAIRCEGIHEIKGEGTNGRWTTFPRNIPIKITIFFEPIKVKPQTLNFACVVHKGTSARPRRVEHVPSSVLSNFNIPNIKVK